MFTNTQGLIPDPEEEEQLMTLTRPLLDAVPLNEDLNVTDPDQTIGILPIYSVRNQGTHIPTNFKSKTKLMLKAVHRMVCQKLEKQMQYAARQGMITCFFLLKRHIATIP